MIVDDALAKFSIFQKMLDGGDTGRRGVEHRSIFQLWFTHHQMGNIGFIETIIRETAGRLIGSSSLIITRRPWIWDEPRRLVAQVDSEYDMVQNSAEEFLI